MSTQVAAFGLPHAHSLPAPVRDAELRPWGFWGSLGWGLFAMTTALFSVVVFMALWMLTHQLQIPSPQDAAFANMAGMMASLMALAVLVIAVKSRNFSLRSYFALDSPARPSRHPAKSDGESDDAEVALAISCRPRRRRPSSPNAWLVVEACELV